MNTEKTNVTDEQVKSVIAEILAASGKRTFQKKHCGKNKGSFGGKAACNRKKKA